MTKLIMAVAAVSVCFNFAPAQSRGRAAARERGEFFRLVKDDEEVKEFLSSDPGAEKELTQFLTVRKVDLNRDGRPEYDVALEAGGICGALGNCPHWIYRRAGGRYELLLHTRAREVTPQKTATGGYRDLRSEAGDTATENYFDISKYDGSKYRTTDCFTRDYSGRRVKVTRVPCANE
ncbi:MAG TPA: hypothetical protein VNZ44_16245 [Pyrinomonadaceae bacterium]|nr:hypothetical protein [Pyrinomonadaceae bacterium]